VKPRENQPGGLLGHSPPAHASQNRAFRNTLVALFLLALAVRGIYLTEIRSIGFFNGLMSDANVYVERATQIAEGDWIGLADFVHAPLYAYLVAVPRLLGFSDLLAPRIIAIVLGAASCCLLAAATRRLFDDRPARIAGLLLALYPPAIFFDGQIQKTSLALFLAILLLWQLVAATQHPSGRAAALCGVTAGLLILTQQSTLILVPLILIWLTRPIPTKGEKPHPRTNLSDSLDSGRVGKPQRSRPRALAIRYSLFCLLSLSVTLLPWAIRNRSVTGRLTLTTPNLGQNFFMGNSAGATGAYLPHSRSRSTGEFEQEEWTLAAEAVAGRPLSLSEVSDHYLRQSLDFIREHPVEWLRLCVKKSLMTWNVYEIADTEDYYLYLEHSALLRTLDAVLHFGVLCPLAAAGVALTWSRRRNLWPLYAWAVLSTVAVAAFVVFARYRFALIPIVLIFASAAIVTGLDSIRRRQARELTWAVAIGACAALATNWPVFLRRQTYPRSYINHAAVLAQQGRFDDAIGELKRALSLDERSIDALVTLASTYIDMNRADEALATLREAETISPNDPEALVGLVAANLAAGRFDDAATEARRALKRDPDEFRAKTGLATALARGGNFHDAVVLFQEVLHRRPKHFEAHFNLGNTYFLLGRHDDAARSFETALRLRRDHPDVLNNLAVLEMSRGHTDQALTLFQRLLHVAPNRPGARAAYEAALRTRSEARRERPTTTRP
jgi:tetratricopeptide (TPR) repeat protein